MKFRTIGTVFLLSYMFLTTSANGQCSIPNGFTVIRNDAQFEEFLNDYGDCQEIVGSVLFEKNITEIVGLEKLKVLDGDLSLEELDVLNSLSGLDNLEMITGSLTFVENDSLKNLQGLENLQTIGNSFVLENTSLRTLEGLNNIKTISGDLSIGYYDVDYTGEFVRQYSNPELSDISSLRNIEKVRNLNVVLNPKLTSLEGLNEIKEVDQLRIAGNAVTEIKPLSNLTKVSEIRIGLSHFNTDMGTLVDSTSISSRIESLVGFEQIDSCFEIIIVGTNLKNLEGLNNLKKVGGKLQLGGRGVYYGYGAPYEGIGNDLLVDISALQNVEFIGDRLEVHENEKFFGCGDPVICKWIDQLYYTPGGGQTCNINDVDRSCKPHVWFQVFFDINQNGLFDLGEYSAYLGKMGILNTLGESSELRPYNDGIMFTFLDQDPLCSYISPEDYKVTTDSIFNLDKNYNGIDTIKIGVSPTKIYSEVSTFLSRSLGICDMEGACYINVQNTGTLPISTLTTFKYTGTLVSSSTPFLEHDVNTKTLKYRLFNIPAAKSETIKLILLYPNISDTDSLKFNLLTEVDNCPSCSEYKEYYNQLVCSWDPNDKACDPTGVLDENYTLFGEELQYKIRFQNLGNYYAHHVIVRDTIDRYLDMSTFRIIDASHEITGIIFFERGNYKFIEVIFREIFLPWADLNEIESNGYFSYSISPYEGIVENTIIKNSATIIFDSNPGIQTNTTHNTMVSEIPISSNNNNATKTEFSVYPNPTSDLIFVRHTLPNDNLAYSISDVYGRQVKKGRLSASESSIDLKGLTAGVYYIISSNQGVKLIKY